MSKTKATAVTSEVKQETTVPSVTPKLTIQQILAEKKNHVSQTELHGQSAIVPDGAVVIDCELDAERLVRNEDGTFGTEAVKITTVVAYLVNMLSTNPQDMVEGLVVKKFNVQALDSEGRMVLLLNSMFGDRYNTGNLTFFLAPAKSNMHVDVGNVQKHKALMGQYADNIKALLRLDTATPKDISSPFLQSRLLGISEFARSDIESLILSDHEGLSKLRAIWSEDWLKHNQPKKTTRASDMVAQKKVEQTINSVSAEEIKAALEA